MIATKPVSSLLTMRIGQGSQIVGTPMTVFPLIWNQRPKNSAILVASAISSGSMVVTERATGASVPTLDVRNNGTRSVLIPQGTILSGGRQDRVVNESVLIRANQQVPLSVSCVQHGRWEYRGHQNFTVEPSMAGVSTRHAAGSTSFGDSDVQGTVWGTVSELQSSLGVRSESEQLTAVFASHRDDIERYVTLLPYVPDAYGLAIAVGKKVVLIEVYADAETCQQMWPQVIRGCTTDALSRRYRQGNPRIQDVAFKLRLLTDNSWQQHRAEDPTKAWRYRFGHNQATALTVDKELLHLSCVRQTAL